MQAKSEVIKSAKRWTLHSLLFLGLWLIITALSFTVRSEAVVVSDLASGVVVLLLSCWALLCPAYWIRWALALVGVWLQFAPLAFWAPDAISYLNDTVIGFLVITLAVVIPGEPSEDLISEGEIPKGWSYNPSGWLQRCPVITLSFFCWMFARLMACYQLGYLDYVWDPIFGNGTMDVITSPLSKKFPVPDAGLGAMAYTIEVILAAHGSVRRWHTLPWFVALFAILVIPVGFTSIVLVMLQPIIVGHWCFWCLLTALSMLLMISFAVDEVAATLQFLRRAKREGRFWQTFWKGGVDPEASSDIRAPKADSPLSEKLKAVGHGLSIPKNLVVTALFGLWMMFSPKIFGAVKPIADFDHIFGALIVSFSFIATAEVVRAARFVNVTLGIALIVVGLFASPLEIANHFIVGALVVVLSFPRGPIQETYGSLRSWIK